jgi:hypothetical protein
MYGPGEEYVFAWPGGTERRTNQAQEGNDAIDLPLFDLLTEILAEANFDGLKRGETLKLCVETSTDEQRTWIYGQERAKVELETHWIQGEPMQLTANSWHWVELDVYGIIEVMNWEPEPHEAEKLQRFLRAIAAVDWASEQPQEVRF